MARVLEAGGRFLVDYLNPAAVRERLVPESVREVGGATVRETRWVEGDPPRVIKQVEMTPASGGEWRCTESVRLYEEDELRGMLLEAGLEVEAAHGDFDGSPFGPDSPRMILFGMKIRSAPARSWKGERPMFQQISVGGDRNLAYLLGDGGEAAAVDPALPGRVLEAAREAGLRIVYIVSTHGHYDHSEGNADLKEATGAKVIAHESAGVAKDIAVRGGERFRLGSTEFEIVTTPGHTPDSICVLWEGRLMTGDTLFVGKVGGTDFGAGARREYESLHEVIAKLPDATEVWPGHDVGVDPSSTVGRERESNPFYLQGSFEEFVDLKRNWAEYKRKHGIA
jgi:glyoxylase-like metal-dependent hydrolase (beta-lactamase superfamily II)